MKDFIIEHYKILSIAASILIEIILTIILIFKKSKFRDVSVTESLKNRLPEFISLAEKSFGSGHGVEKLNFVLAKVSTFYKLLTGNDFVLDSWIGAEIKALIEDILSTPQKK